jgi:hypothetical protein
MFHKSELGEHARRFPSDRNGNVPEHDDHWRDMEFEHGPNDPNEEGVSEEERKRRIKYLDEEWWPEVIARVNKEKEKLASLPGGNPIHRWREEVVKDEPQPHGFRVE